MWIGSLMDEVHRLRQRNIQLTDELTKAKSELESKTREISALTNKTTAFSAENETLRKSLSEAPLGFPSLLEALREYDFQHDKRLAYWLETKSHPAYTVAQTVKAETKKRRDTEQGLRILQYLS